MQTHIFDSDSGCHSVFTSSYNLLQLDVTYLPTYVCKALYVHLL